MAEQKTLSLCDLYSHPGKPLQKHLARVYQLAIDALRHKKIQTQKFEIDEEELGKMVQVATLCHDFAKSTSYFQEYLHKRRTKGVWTHHSYLSSLFAFYIAQQLDMKFPFIPSWVVKKHHGNIENLEHASLNFDNLYQKQLSTINSSTIESIYNPLFSPLNLTLDFETFKKTLYEDSRFWTDLCEESWRLEKNGLAHFMLIQFIYSLLIDSDKLDAAIDAPETIKKIRDEQKRMNIPHAVDIHLKKSQLQDIPSAINRMRTDIYHDAIQYLETIDLNNKIYSINVPTGLGKTLTSLSFALKLKDKIKNSPELGFNPKIIYCLPFTSIIDQNYQVTEDVLKSNNIEITETVLCKHHYLSELAYTIKSQGKDECPYEYEFETDKAQMLIESWMSSIIITTFVQFFESLISGQNRSLKKYHNIVNSIVILDEVQSIPTQYWELVRVYLTHFSEIFNTYFILVTATQPLIFNESKGDILEVITKKRAYYQSPLLNRINLIKDLNPQSVEQFSHQLLEDIVTTYPDKSFLVILNTIHSSQEVFQFIKANLDPSIELLYLSTTILPCKRKEMIEKIQKSKNRKIVISTQVVEAGVDIDLDIVYRDMAPLDSIFQASGRCNRHGSHPTKGMVKIFKLKDVATGQLYCRYIYDKALIDATDAVLKSADAFQENSFMDLANQYYQSINCKNSKILKSIQALNFADVSKTFKLIEDDTLCSTDIFIELPAAVHLKQDFEKLMQIQDKIQRHKEFLKIKRDFYQYIVSIRLKPEQAEFLNQPQYRFGKEDESTLFYIPVEQVNCFYDDGGIGFNLTKSSTAEKVLIL